MLLLDEPTAALDLRHQELVLRLCRGRAATGAAVGPPSDVLRPALLSRVYRHPVEVLPHPRTGAALVLPHRP